MRFAPEYVRYVLNDNFEDAKRLFLSPLMAIHCAHLVMLADRAIIGPTDARRLREALDSISQDEVKDVRYDGICEDLFFYVEQLLIAACGEEIAGRLHTARSRNDIDMTMYRMRQREFILALYEATLALRDSLLDVAAKHRDTVMAVHTHTQPAQPTTVAHYLLAVIEQLERDAVRLQAAFKTTNRSPLGACAITGTGFPIDRQLTSDLLGFDGPTGNTYGSIATVDYLLESVSATTVLLSGLGRFVQDLLLWGTREFSYVRFGDGFVQCSSIMPQKRNPVAIEHARAIGSKALGQAQAIVVTIHNTPFGDVVDTEDDLQPLVSSTFRDAMRAVRLVAAAMQTAEFDPERLEARAARRRNDADRAGRYAIARSRRAVQDRASDRLTRPADVERKSISRSAERARGGLPPVPGPHAAVHARRSRAHPQPALFRRGSPHARRPGARRDGAGPLGVAAAARARPCLADGSTPRRVGVGGPLRERTAAL